MKAVLEKKYVFSVEIPRLGKEILDIMHSSRTEESEEMKDARKSFEKKRKRRQ